VDKIKIETTFDEDHIAVALIIENSLGLTFYKLVGEYLIATFGKELKAFLKFEVQSPVGLSDITE